MNVQWVSGGGEVLSVVWSVRAQNLSVVTHCSKPDNGDRHRWGCSEARNLLSAGARGYVQMTSVLRGEGVSQFLTIGGGGCVISIL